MENTTLSFELKNIVHIVEVGVSEIFSLINTNYLNTHNLS